VRIKSSFWRITIQVIAIIVIATVGYQLIYAHNPFQQLLMVFTRPMAPSILNAPAPELVGINQWLNTDGNQPLALSALRGRVVLVDFWTYSCINCKRDAPYLNAWYERYRDQGLIIIGVHTPEFRFEQKPENVQAAVREYGIQYPVGLDNEYQIWRAYHNQYWPAKYLIDKNGIVVYRTFGEGRYEETEQKIQELLDQQPAEGAQ